MAKGAFSRFKPIVFNAGATRSIEVVLPAGSKVVGTVVFPIDAAGVQVSVELWDRSTLIQQSKVIPSTEGYTETALVGKWLLMSLTPVGVLDEVVNLPATPQSALVLSLCRPATDNGVRVVFVEVAIP